jgi:DNA processing protein
MDGLVYSIWLSLCCTPGSATFKKLLSKFDNPIDVYEANESEIRRAVGSRVSDCSLLNNKDLTRANEILSFCTSFGVGIVTYFDKEFPVALKDIPTPPVLLYYRGALPDFNSVLPISVVGTRRLSEYGKTNSFKISYDLARAGATVVSGMAIGIDGVALAGALTGGGTTIAVIGSGIDVCYPLEHKRLAKEIVKRGCVLTEYAPGTKPDKYNFPRRNRIISGLSVATVVIEGRERSGAIITARYAKVQNRTLYAFPGNVGNPNSELSNLLIKNGAKLCTSADDIVRDFEKTYPGKLNPYNLSVNSPFNIESTLRELEVAALTPNDKVFSHKIKGEKVTPLVLKNEEIPVAQNIVREKETIVESAFNFDKETLNLYKRIPTDKDCSIESLVFEGETLRQIMRLLLKLEMGRFVEILPGERVRRNLK